ncbi:hypothetical protein DPMN_149563, partial [Dreissena polymorpha]
MKISWSPQDKEKFLTFTASTVKLYQTYSYSQGEILPEGSLQISDERYAANIASVSDLPQMKCVEWFPGQTADDIIAIGLASPGKILLSNFGRKGESDLISKEFCPKHQRHCIYLSWNPVHTHFLAEGLDKARNESCIYIWDVNARTNNDLSVLQDRRYSSSMAEASVVKPCLEIGAGDMTSSFSWFKKETWTFVAGMNGKQLRVYDLREPSRAHLITHSKSVFGVCSDPLHESRVAAYSESHVSVWDVRQFEKPILGIPTEREVLKIAWCPTRSGDLAVLCKGSTIVKLYDVRHSVTGTDDLEPVIFDRTLQPNRQHAVNYFAWHPTCENRISTLTPTGHVNDNFIFDKLPISLNANMTPAWIFGRQINIQTYEAEADMSVRIKQRAKQEYGLHRDNLWKNAVVVADEPNLHALWHWLDLSTKLLNKEEVPKKLTKTGRYIGVLDLLHLQDAIEETESEEVCLTWQYPDGIHGGGREKKPMLQYTSKARLRCLQLCGWWYNKEPDDLTDPIELFLDSMVNENMEYERAAAIALFNLKIGRAVEILSSDITVKDTPQLGLVAMALSGFTEERNAMWRKTCTELRLSMKDPYLRAMFSFLASDRDNYDEVLKDDVCMAVKDRVAFACLYLNSSKLLTYLTELCKNLKQKGDLDGILLTGLTNEEGLELLGNYVDLTSDIQTAALAVMYSSPSDLSRNEQVLNWIEGYRDLLNQWKMWHH